MISKKYGRLLSLIFIHAGFLFFISCNESSTRPGEEICSPDKIDIPAASVSDILARSFEERIQGAFSQLEKLNFSLVLGISHNGEQFFKELGKPREDGIEPGNTQIDLNSITKTVTGIMILKLVEEKKLSFSDELGDIFNSVPADKSRITVHQLLTHSAGFSDAIGDDSEVIERDQYIERAFNTPLIHSPGSKYEYSNVGYSILAAIIEKKANKTYEEYLTNNVLVNTNISNMGYEGVYNENESLTTDDGRTIKEVSWGGHRPYWNLIGNGGLISTPKDFISLIMSLNDGAIVSEKLVHESRRPHVPENEVGYTSYGYGLVVQDVPEVGKVYWHNGSNGTFTTVWAEFEDQGDIIFTAASDKEECTAITAMSIIQLYLYGIALE